MGQKPSRVNRSKRIEQHCIELNRKIDILLDALKQGTLVSRIVDTRGTSISSVDRSHMCIDRDKSKSPQVINVQAESPLLVPIEEENIPIKLEHANCGFIIRYVLKTEHNVALLGDLFTRNLDTINHLELLKDFWEWFKIQYSTQLKWIREHRGDIFDSIVDERNDCIYGILLNLIGFGSNPDYVMKDQKQISKVDSREPSIQSVSQLWSIFAPKDFSLADDTSATNSIIDSDISYITYFDIIRVPIRFRYDTALEKMYVKGDWSDQVFSQLWDLEMKLAFFSFLTLEWDSESNIMDRIFCGFVYHPSPECSKEKKQFFSKWHKRFSSHHTTIDSQIFGRDSPMNSFLPRIYTAHQKNRFLLLKAARK
jgi:hypothetical protein